MSQSASDLAPFVASVLRDGAMAELMEEINKLKLLVDERLNVKITGRRGSPIYYEGSLKDGYCSHRGRCFEVMFDEGEEDDNDDTDNDDTNDAKAKTKATALPPTALKDLEIRLGNTVIQRLENIDTIVGSCNAPFFTDDNFYRDNKYNRKGCFHPARKEIIFKTTTNSRKYRVPVPFLIARFGPDMTFKEYYKLDDRLSMSSLMELYKSGKAKDIIIEGLTFSKCEIQASTAVLEKMGYNDSDADNDHRDFVKTVDTLKIPVRKS